MKYKDIGPKKWYTSKSVWSAVLKALAGIAASAAMVASGDMTLADFVPGAALTLWSAVDVIIRYKTTQRIV